MSGLFGNGGRSKSPSVQETPKHAYRSEKSRNPDYFQRVTANANDRL